MEHQNATDADADAEFEQTTLVSFDKVEVEDPATGEVREGVAVDVETTESEVDHQKEIEQYERLPGHSPLHEKIMAMAEELNMDTRVVQLPRLMSVKTGKDGAKYITDTNEVVRYYLDESVLVTTDDYEDREKISEGTQRKNDLLQMYETA